MADYKNAYVELSVINYDRFAISPGIYKYRADKVGVGFEEYDDSSYSNLYWNDGYAKLSEISYSYYDRPAYNNDTLLNYYYADKDNDGSKDYYLKLRPNRSDYKKYLEQFNAAIHVFRFNDYADPKYLSGTYRASVSDIIDKEITDEIMFGEHGYKGDYSHMKGLSDLNRNCFAVLYTELEDTSGGGKRDTGRVIDYKIISAEVYHYDVEDSAMDYGGFSVYSGNKKNSDLYDEYKIDTNYYSGIAYSNAKSSATDPDLIDEDPADNDTDENAPSETFAGFCGQRHENKAQGQFEYTFC